MQKRFMVTEEVDVDTDIDGFKTCHVLAVTETPDGWGYVIDKGGYGVRVSKRDLVKLRGMLDAAAREQ